MATVYILYSKEIDQYFIGSCKKLNTRLGQHLNKAFEGSFTPRASDWTVFLMIDHLTYQQARRIEGHIKKMKSRVFIENLKRYPEIISKLKTRYS